LQNKHRLVLMTHEWFVTLLGQSVVLAEHSVVL